MKIDKHIFMVKKQTQNITLEAIDKLLVQQTVIILSAIDDKLKKMELSIDKKIDKLTTTLDGFLKRLAIVDDEFEIMKLDINRMKEVIKEKLGIDLS